VDKDDLRFEKIRMDNYAANTAKSQSQIIRAFVQ